MHNFIYKTIYIEQVRIYSKGAVEVCIMGNLTQYCADIKDEQQTKKPPRWHVVLLNDDFTPMDFVIDLLTYVFGHTEETATAIMLAVHNQGRGIAGTYSWEVAETKADKAMQLAIQNEYPLQVITEPAEG